MTIDKTRKAVFLFMVAQETSGEFFRVVRQQAMSVNATGRITVHTDDGRRTYDGSALGVFIFPSAKEALTAFVDQQRKAADRAALLASRGMTAIAWARREIERLASEDEAGDRSPEARDIKVGDSYDLVHRPSDSFGYPVMIPVTVTIAPKPKSARSVTVEIAVTSGAKVQHVAKIEDLRVKHRTGDAQLRAGDGKRGDRRGR